MRRPISTGWTRSFRGLPEATAAFLCTGSRTARAFSPSCRTASAARGLYLLDEPEAALSPMRQMAMLVQIDELKKRQSQFIIATHSRF